MRRADEPRFIGIVVNRREININFY